MLLRVVLFAAKAPPDLRSASSAHSSQASAILSSAARSFSFAVFASRSHSSAYCRNVAGSCIGTPDDLLSGCQPDVYLKVPRREPGCAGNQKRLEEFAAQGFFCARLSACSARRSQLCAIVNRSALSLEACAFRASLTHSPA